MSTRSRNAHHQQTTAARFAVDSDESHGAVIPPLHMSSTFSFEGFGEKREYDYTRSGNPTRDQLAGALRRLDCSETEWRVFSDAASAAAERGDVRHFVASVERLAGLERA